MTQFYFAGPFYRRRPAPALSVCALSLCIALGAADRASATDGYYLTGYGTQAEGVAGAAVAYPQDSLAIASNPAAALFLGGRFDAGAEWFRPDRSATITGSPAGLDGSYDGNARSDYLIPSLGWVRQLSPNLAIGIAAYGNGLGSSYNINPYQKLVPPGGPYIGTAGFSFEQFFLSPTAAYQIAPGHSIGVSVNLAYQRFSANGLGAFTAFSTDPASVTSKGVDEAFGIGARIGYLGHITPQLSIGAAYTTETFFQNFNAYRGLLADQGSFDAPQNFTVGAAYKLTPRLDLTAEYQFINYSSIPALSDPGLASILGAGEKLGSSNGPGFNWQDSNVFRIGAVYQLTPELKVRGGYAYSTEVIRNDETFLNILAPATVQSQFTAGFTWESPSRRWEYSGYVLYAPETQVNGQNSLAYFGGGEANIRLSEFSVGFSVGYKFDQRESFKD